MTSNEINALMDELTVMGNRLIQVSVMLSNTYGKTRARRVFTHMQAAAARVREARNEVDSLPCDPNPPNETAIALPDEVTR